MSSPNGHVNGSGSSHLETKESALPSSFPETSTPSQFTPEAIKECVELLEVPFDAHVIEWRVTNTSNRNGNLRGQVVPYADQRAYTDRLNALFTPAGWTRKYAVHTSANVQRSEDEKLVAKVFVTCDLTVFGLGSHSATGEEWIDNPNAGTSAEAQAFKRSCACFGLGRYLYYFSGIWVDLDERKRPVSKPALTDWATPEGWRQGLRPRPVINEGSRLTDAPTEAAKKGKPHYQSSNVRGRADLIRQIEAMAEPLGSGLYRGLLKKMAHVWHPGEVQDTALLQKVLTHMQAADRGLRRLDAALDQTGREPLAAILQSLDLKSLDRVGSLETLHKIVVALEEKAQGQS